MNINHYRKNCNETCAFVTFLLYRQRGERKGREREGAIIRGRRLFQIFSPKVGGGGGGINRGMAII